MSMASALPLQLTECYETTMTKRPLADTKAITPCLSYNMQQHGANTYSFNCTLSCFQQTATRQHLSNSLYSGLQA